MTAFHNISCQLEVSLPYLEDSKDRARGSTKRVWQVSLHWIGQEDPLPEYSGRLVVLDPIRDVGREKKIYTLRNSSEVGGRICLLRSSATKDADAVLEMVFRNAPTAVIVGGTPTMPGRIRIPFIIANKQQMNDLCSNLPIKVSLSSNPEQSLAPTRLPPTEKESYAQVATRGSRSAEGDVASNYSVLSPSTQPVEEEGSKGFLQRAVDFVWRREPPIKAALNRILDKQANWMDQGDGFHSYKEACSLLQEACSAVSPMSKIEELIHIKDALLSHFEQRNLSVDLVVLAFSVRAYTRFFQIAGPNERYGKKKDIFPLEAAVLNCLEAQIPAQDGPKLFSIDGRFVRDHVRPSKVLSNYTQAVVTDVIIGGSSGDTKKIPNRLLLSLLWIRVHHCGDGVWEGTFVIAREDFYSSQRDELVDRFGAIFALSLGVSLQPTFHSVCELVENEVRFADDTNVVVLEDFVIGRICTVLQRSLRYFRRGASATPLKLCLKLFGQVLFTGNNESTKDTFAREVVSSICFRGTGTFKHLTRVFALLHPDQQDFDRFQTAIHHGILADLRDSSHCRDCRVNISDMIELLQNPVGRLLANPEGVSAVVSITEMLASGRSMPWNKVRLLAAIHKAFIASGLVSAVRAAYVTERCKPWILAAFNGRGHGHGNDKLLDTVFQLAVEETNSFHHGNEELSLVESVAQAAIPNSAGGDLVRDPRRLVALKLDGKNECAGPLMLSLLNQLEKSIRNHCQTINTAMGFCHGLHGSSAGPELQAVGLRILLDSFWKWSPSNIEDVLSLGPEALPRLCFHLSPAVGQGLLSSEKNKCTEKMKNLIADWNDRFVEEGLSLSQIEQVSGYLSADVCEVVKETFEINLPGKAAVDESCKAFHSLKSLITCQLSVAREEVPSIDQPIVQILEGYNSFPAKGGELHSLLTKYSGCRKATCNIDRTLRDMRSDCAYASAFREENDEVLRIADFFLHSPSVLFKNELGFGEWTSLPAESLFEKLRLAVISTKGLFGPVSTLKAVRESTAMVEASGVDMETELSFLSSCTLLGIGDLEVQLFAVASVLSDVSSPLWHYIQCCKQFKFSFVEMDDAFDELLVLVDELNSSAADRWTMKDCVDATRRICALICPDSSSESGTNSTHQSEALQSMSPLLGFFMELSNSSDVWILVRDMQWLGDDGLKRFRDEHDNITNILLGDSESFEMRVLDSLDPVVRRISAIASIGSLESMKEFLTSLKKRSEFTTMDTALLEDLKCVQGTISSIRDWFSNGMDEMAAVMACFERVHESGEYSICNGTLALIYSSAASPSETVTLEGVSLANFIQQLGFVQNDNAAVSGRVKAFIDQHQMIIRAANHLLQMYQVGFEKVHLPAFTFRAKQKSLNRAVAMLASASEQWEECQDWLQATRVRFPSSLFFWTEELFQMSGLLKLIQQGGMSPTVRQHTIDKLVRSAARLLHAESHRYQPETSLTNADFLDLVVSLIESTGDWVPTTEASWLVNISDFLESCSGLLRSRLDGDGVEVQEVVTGNDRCLQHETVIHTLECSREREYEAVLRIMNSIYANRLPAEFEILDAFVHCSMEKVSTFLERAAAFPFCTFTVLNVHLLGGEQQEKLLGFLSRRRDIEKKGVRLHCIQRRGTILHTSPWVEGRCWDDDSIADEIDHQNISSWLRGAIHGGGHDATLNVTTVFAAKCGTGKTRHIRSSIERLRSTAQYEVTAGALSIHEGTTMASLVAELRSQFPVSSTQMAIHVSLLSSLQESRGFVELLNHFFFSFLVLRSVHDPESTASFTLGDGSWNIYVELPSFNESRDAALQWVAQQLPILSQCSTFEEPPTLFHVDEETMRVCMYLRAFENGTINRKFAPYHGKSVLFVLDESGSMRGAKWQAAIDNTLHIFDSHLQIDDMVGLYTFDHVVRGMVKTQLMADEATRCRLREQIDQGRNSFHGGGTSMYGALREALESIEHLASERDTWIICLTDGFSADSPALIEDRLRTSHQNLHLVLIGVGLCNSIHPNMEALCRKYQDAGESTTKGFFVPTVVEVGAINAAFQQVASRIPVSQTFELDGALEEEECRALMERHRPQFVDSEDMILQKFWIKFLYRRVKVLDENQDFNYNETHDRLGSSLMEAMLKEVEQFLSVEQNRDWGGNNHTQLVYDFTNREAPEFRLICTAPDLLDDETRAKFEELDLPGFAIPSKHNLKQRATLDCYLSQALNIPLLERSDGEMRLKCIDVNGFVLTLDFTIKLLAIHERIACRVPCIMEGETGVSKTALTKMYSILVNSSLQAEAKALTEGQLAEMEASLRNQHAFCRGSEGGSAHERLKLGLTEAAESTMEDTTMFSRDLHHLMVNACKLREGIFQDPPDSLSSASNGETNAVLQYLEWFSMSALVPTFFEINVDASLSEDDVIECFKPVRQSAHRLRGTNALVVVFLDEVNTASIMGLFKEIIIDRSLCGSPLEENISVVAACNPARNNLLVNSGKEREYDLGKDWASGHYQVSQLPPSVAKLKWQYGSLDREQEKEFILRMIEMIGRDTIPDYLIGSLTELVSMSQETTRNFAFTSISRAIERSIQSSNASVCVGDARERARSVVSLRDIQRVFSLFQFFSDEFVVTCGSYASPNQRHRHAMLLAISVVYYLRLDSDSRLMFVDMLESLPTERLEADRLQDVLNSAMDAVIKETVVPAGIAITRGLKENAFMTLVCALSFTPLMIIGPPGSSKTLSVNIVSDNANGEESPNPFYRKHARLSTFHYQCSKASTSKEVASVFEKAIQRQTKVDPLQNKCLVFMDEAGLPEEEKESLKVLHYYLEGHMSTKAKVGFVAITNHVLDAAKSNRCVSLLRQEPDDEELSSITLGVLFGSPVNGHFTTARQVKLDEIVFRTEEFSSRLCRSYTKLLHDDGHFSWFESFFGLRDLIYFLKAIRRTSEVNEMVMTTSTKVLIRAVEENFNGLTKSKLKELAVAFLGPLMQMGAAAVDEVVKYLRHPMDVVRDAVLDCSESGGISNKPRFKLIIDESNDDSIMRLLSNEGTIDARAGTLFKLSDMPEDSTLEKLRFVAGVKYSAQQGRLVAVSGTKFIESFYDLFNQRFRVVKTRDGGVSLYANIAVGGISRRSLVRPTFQCIVQVNQAQLDALPAPFLNRFEKYRLGTKEVLTSRWRNLGGLEGVMRAARVQAGRLCALLEQNGLFGWVRGQTLDSVFIDMLLPGQPIVEGSSFSGCLEDAIVQLVNYVTSLGATHNDARAVMGVASRFLPMESAMVIDELSGDEGNDLNQATLLTNAFRSIYKGNSQSQHGDVLQILLQMAITRLALFKILQIATPEAIFSRRNVLPPELLAEYFKQPHFSLETVVSQNLQACERLGRLRTVVVHTRTDANIRGMPALAVSRDVSNGSERHSLDIIRAMVHRNVDLLVVEHLARLRSEASLRSSIKSWAESKGKQAYLLFVNMDDPQATSRVNFVRTCVEQISRTCTKAFLLVLHMSSAGSSSNAFYPALFLGGWDHVFLDGVGHEQTAMDTCAWIEMGCALQNGEVLSSNDFAGIGSSVASLLPRAISSAASQGIFYRGQIEGSGGFKLHERAVTNLMRRRAGDATIGDIICSRFADMWMSKNLKHVLQRSSDGLLAGTTQLSMSLALQSTFQDAFGSFLVSILRDMNQWRNLDIILWRGCTALTADLFGGIVRRLPILPFEELCLQRQRNHQLQPFPSLTEWDGPQTMFPFFRLVSSFLEEVVSRAELELKKKTVQDTLLSHPTSVSFEAAAAVLNDVNTDSPFESNVVQYTIDFIVQAACESRDLTLFECYIAQYTRWKFGCPPNEGMARWMMSKMAQSSTNLLEVHIVGRKHEMDLARMTALVDSDPDFGHMISGGIDDLSFDAVAEKWLNGCLGKLETLLGTAPTVKEWSKQFSVTLRQIISAFDGASITTESYSYRLRAMGMISILVDSSAPDSIVRDAIRVWYRAEEGQMVWSFEEAPSLKSFVQMLVDGVEVWSANAMESMFLRFFSSPWLHLDRTCWQEDLRFLCSSILDKTASPRFQKTAAILLRNVCSASCSASCSSPFGFTNESLHIICSCLSTGGTHFFTEQGRRNGLPHFVPSWMRLDEESEALSSPLTLLDGDGIDVYFSQYKHSFGDSPLADAIYDMVLSVLLEEASNTSSETLLLALMGDIDRETNISLEEIMRLSHLRSHPTTVERGDNLLLGSSVSAIILDARLLCFLAKVAFELSVSAQAPALDGFYAANGRRVLEMSMNLPGCHWQDFFFSCIIRVRGEGNLVVLLREDSLLRTMAWADSWGVGLPEEHHKVGEALQNAENELAEALREEEQKEREHRLCPHCGQPFIVAAMNCGHFVCGRDAHAAQNAHGCGRNFEVGQARRYVADSTIIAPLQARVQELRRGLQACDNGAARWASAREMAVPVLSVELQKSIDGPTLVPVSYLCSAPDLLDSPVATLVSAVSDGVKALKWFSIVPDLIEIYIWLHTTFRYLVSREDAMEMKLSAVMQKVMLQRRFDATSVVHLSKLWGRVAASLDEFLESTDGRVFWNCEEFKVPFHSTKDVTLMMFLSEASHPTEGYDYLFLIIQQIISWSNTFSRKVNRGTESIGHHGSMKEINPRHLLHGSSNLAVLSTPILASNSGQRDLASICWQADCGTFDIRRFSHLIMFDIGMQNRPMVSNPMECLREQFCFRDSATVDQPSTKENSTSTLGREGYRFTRPHDHRLFDDAKAILCKLGISQGDERIRRTLSVEFTKLEYGITWDLLEWVRNALAAVSSWEVTSNQASFGQAVSNEEEASLSDLGLPSAVEDHADFIAALDAPQVVELVNFLGYRMATESYRFVDLPLCMMDPLAAEAVSIIRNGVEKLAKRDGVSKTAEQLTAFEEDVLAFYQPHLRNIATENRFLRPVLLEIHACEPSDPILLILPKDLCVRNYVPLMQELQQLKLSLLSQDCLPESRDEFGEVKSGYAKPVRGRCWLWESDTKSTAVDDQDAASVDSVGGDDDDSTDGLWFEHAIALCRLQDPVQPASDPLDKGDGLQKSESIDPSGEVDPSSSDENDNNDGSSCASLLCNSRSNGGINRRGLEDRDGPHTAGCDGGTRTNHDLEVVGGNEIALVKEASACLIQKRWRATREATVKGRNDSRPLHHLTTKTCHIDDTGNPAPFTIKPNISKVARTYVWYKLLVLAFTMMLAVVGVLSFATKKVDQRENTNLPSGRLMNDLSEFQEWLQKHRMSPEVREHLTRIGVRSMEDVLMVMDSFEHALESLPLLDKAKLQMATDAYREKSREE